MIAKDGFGCRNSSKLGSRQGPHLFAEEAVTAVDDVEISRESKEK